MKSLRVLGLLLAAAAVGVGQAAAQSPKVDISMNLFPTTPGSPNTGGTWTMVAKTNSPPGISGISFWVLRVNTIGITSEPDIANLANGGNPYNGTFGGIINIVYGQDPFTSVVVGVGTPLMSDGPDPLGNPDWNRRDAPLISGTYSSLAPAFSTTPGSITGANVYSSSLPPYFPSFGAEVSTVVRVIPEPSTVALALGIASALIAITRRR